MTKNFAINKLGQWYTDLNIWMPHARAVELIQLFKSQPNRTEYLIPAQDQHEKKLSR